MLVMEPEMGLGGGLLKRNGLVAVNQSCQKRKRPISFPPGLSMLPEIETRSICNRANILRDAFCALPFRKHPLAQDYIFILHTPLLSLAH